MAKLISCILADIVDTCDVDRLQCALDSLAEWAEMWQLPISISKCCTVHFGNDSLCRPLCINSSILPTVKKDIPRSRQWRQLGGLGVSRPQESEMDIFKITFTSFHAGRANGASIWMF